MVAFETQISRLDDQTANLESPNDSAIFQLSRFDPACSRSFAFDNCPLSLSQVIVQLHPVMLLHKLVRPRLRKSHFQQEAGLQPDQTRRLYNLGVSIPSCGQRLAEQSMPSEQILPRHVAHLVKCI